MALSSSYLPIPILFLFYSFLHQISSSQTTNTIPISFFNQIPYSDPFQRLTHLASISKVRAHKIKNPQNTPISTTPIHPLTGAYSISLSFGTPPQSIPMIMDTGSSFSWFPCTKRYICRNCSANDILIPSFLPKMSSSAKVVGCMNPKCGWIHKSFDPQSSCQDCDRTNCSQICPPYIILYGLGSTGGVAMVDTLNLPQKSIPGFLVGCSIFSSNQPAGLAGFGRGISSLPSQLGLKKFSYCLVSHKFDNSPKTSLLVMDPDSDSGKKTEKFSYTSFLKNLVRPENVALSEYYYLGLRKIAVGGHKVEILYENLSFDSNGNGGTIVDSGTTFTYMNTAVFNAVANAFEEQVKEYERAKSVEGLIGLRPCYNVTGHKNVRMPELKLHFKGGAKMELPLENVFVAVDDKEMAFVCLAMVTDDVVMGTEIVSGPSIILGNFFMQNFEVEYDLRNERFGFKQQSCE